MMRGVILDVDGTLVLSNDVHARSWVEAFQEYGYDVPFERVRPLLGMGGDKLLPQVAPGLSDKEGDGKQIAGRRKQIFLERYAPTLEAAPGAHDLVQRLHDNGLKLIVASSAKPEELEVLLKVAGVDALLLERISSSDVEQSKPAPDVVKVALDRLALPAGEVVMVGDTPYDVQSAHGAEIGLIALRCGGFSDRDLDGATAIYDDPADLLAHYDKSPLSSQ